MCLFPDIEHRTVPIQQIERAGPQAAGPENHEYVSMLLTGIFWQRSVFEGGRMLLHDHLPLRRLVSGWSVGGRKLIGVRQNEVASQGHRTSGTAP